MKIFPIQDYTFKIIGEEQEAIYRLKARTEWSESLTSRITDKSFRGIIKGNTFKIISSETGKGAFCVLTGKIKNKTVEVNVEINKAFRILLGIIFCLPIIGLIVQIISKEEFSMISLVMALFQLLIIRFIFIEFAFRRLSKLTLNKLSNALHIDQIEGN